MPLRSVALFFSALASFVRASVFVCFCLFFAVAFPCCVAVAVFSVLFPFPEVVVSEDSSELEPVAPVSDLVLFCPPEESLTRQEFYHDSLVSTILKRSGVPSGRPYPVGDVDFDVDLTRAHEIDREARAAFLQLPVSARRFGSFAALSEALLSGRVTLAELGIASSDAQGGPASESAPVVPPNA